MKVSMCVKFLVWSLCVSLGLAYNCYECQEQMGKDLACEVNVETVLTPNCTTSFVCIKYIWSSNGTSAVYRGCAPRSKCVELEATATDINKLTFCETCEEALCNSAITRNYITSVVLAGMLLVFARLF